MDREETQQAWIVENRGQPKDVGRKKECTLPGKPAKGEVLVKVQAAALNPVGYKLTKLLPIAKRPLPAEYDLAGVIEDPNGSSFSKGDEVFGFIPVRALQQYAKLPADHLVKRVSNVSPVEAAGFTLTGLTAWQALLTNAKFEAGQTVFVNGGSSAVGGFAIQIAKAKGAAKVVATASGKNEAYVRGLGADEFIDYTKEPLYEYLKKNPPSPKYHLVFDAVGLPDPDLYINSPAYLAPGGAFVSAGGGSYGVKSILRTFVALVRPAWLGGAARPYKIAKVQPTEADLKAIADLDVQGKIKPLVDSVYAFDDLQASYDRLQTGRATGKVVIEVDPTWRIGFANICTTAFLTMYYWNIP